MFDMDQAYSMAMLIYLDVPMGGQPAKVIELTCLFFDKLLLMKPKQVGGKRM